MGNTGKININNGKRLFNPQQNRPNRLDKPGLEDPDIISKNTDQKLLLQIH